MNLKWQETGHILYLHWVKSAETTALCQFVTNRVSSFLIAYTTICRLHVLSYICKNNQKWAKVWTNRKQMTSSSLTLLILSPEWKDRITKTLNFLIQTTTIAYQHFQAKSKKETGGIIYLCSALFVAPIICIDCYINNAIIKCCI